MTQPYKICPQCGEGAVISAAQCGRCGRFYRTTAPPAPSNQTQVFVPLTGPTRGISIQPGYHSPAIAVLWSSLCCICAGQFYNRQYVKGILLVCLMWVTGPFTYGISPFLLWIAAMIDAHQIAQKLNRGDVVGEWECF